MPNDVNLLQSPFFLLIIAWSLVWKGLALWRAAKRGDKFWYIVILVVNTVGIVEIIYLLATQNKKKKTINNENEPKTF